MFTQDSHLYHQYECEIDPGTVSFSPFITRAIFPLELLHEIVFFLASGHDLAHGYKPYVLQGLYHLCLCNRALYEITIPHLYSTIIISTAHQLMLFHRTFTNLSTDSRRQIHSLSLEDFPHALCPPSSMLLIDLLDGLSGHLRRLVFARQVVYPSHDILALCNALEACHQLEEFSSTRCADLSSMLVCWPSWQSLRRLALHQTFVDKEFIRLVTELPCLTHLVLDDPRQGERIGSSLLPSLLADSRRLEKLMVITHVCCNWEYPHVRDLSVSKRSNLHFGLEVVYIELKMTSIGISLACQRWLQGQINAGTLWEL